MKSASPLQVILSLVVLDACFSPLLRMLISEPSDLALAIFALAAVVLVAINILLIVLAVRSAVAKEEVSDG